METQGNSTCSSSEENKGEETNVGPKASPQADVESGNAQLVRALHERHLQMIAIGGSIGAGLFIGSGKALSSGGPANLLLGFVFVGVMVLCSINALGELAVIYPVNGAFYMYSSRFIDPAWGFALGWQYAVSWLVTLPFEITCAGLTIRLWTTSINIGVWIALFLSMLILIQFFGIKGYGESEFILALIKVIACVGLIILGVIINVGGVPSDNRGYIGGRYWHEPGAFRNGFKGFTVVVVAAAFAYGGAEMVGLAAAETVNPQKSIPKASKQVLWRVLIFYVVNILLVGLNVPSDSPMLLGAKGGNTKASPFVLATQLAGIKVIPSIINAVIMLSVISVANTCSYGSTRTLQALAAAGNAPKVFAYIDRKGRPIWCVVLQVAFGFLAFINQAAAGETIFVWLMSLGGLSSLFITASICLSHIMFRRAWKLQGRSEESLLYRSPLGITGSIIGLTLAAGAILATFYLAVFPISPRNRAESFFEHCMAAPLIIITAIGYKVYSSDWKLGVDLRHIDLDDGRRVELHSDKPEAQRKLSWARKMLSNLF